MHVYPRNTQGVFPRATWADRPLPWVHCYTFARGEGDEARLAAIAAAEKYLGCKLDEARDSVTAHVVRDVAPNKLMFCVSFRVPKEIGLKPEGEEKHGLVPQKRPREDGGDSDSA